MWIHPCNSFSFFLFGMKYGDAICCCYLGTGRNSFRRCNRTDTLHERSSMMWTTHGCLHFLHLPLLHYVSYLLLCLSIVYWQMPDNSRVSSVSPPFRIIDCYKDTESGPITLGTFALRALLFFPSLYLPFFYFYLFLLYYWFVRQPSKIHARISLSPCPAQLRIAARIDWLIWWRDTWTCTLFTSLCHSIIRYAFTWFNSISFRIVSASDAIFFFLSIGWDIERERERKKTTSIIYQPKCR